MARVMLSPGMFTAFAASMAVRRRELHEWSPPPMRAATVSSLEMREKAAPLVEPIASFCRLILLHRLWPDMRGSSGWGDGSNTTKAAPSARGDRDGSLARALDPPDLLLA